MSSNNELVPGFNDERDDSLKINLDRIPDVDKGLVIHLNGYIDTYNSSFFQKRIQKVVDNGYINLIFNCAALNYVSSTGIGSFTAFLKMVKPKDSMADSVSFFRNGAQVEDTPFPKIFGCPVCSKRLKATKAGRFRCSECKSILAIDQQGQVFLG